MQTQNNLDEQCILPIQPQIIEELTTYLASLHIRKALSAIDPKCLEVDFYSFLKENCRDHIPASAIASGTGKGNRHIYGTIRTRKAGGRVVYRTKDLDDFVKHCEANPSLIEFMTRSVH